MSVPHDVQRPTSSDVGRLGQALRRLGIAGPVEYAFQVLHGLSPSTPADFRGNRPRDADAAPGR